MCVYVCVCVCVCVKNTENKMLSTTSITKIYFCLIIIIIILKCSYNHAPLYITFLKKHFSIYKGILLQSDILFSLTV